MPRQDRAAARAGSRSPYGWPVTAQPPFGPDDRDSGTDDVPAGADPFAALGGLFGPGGLGSMQDLLAQAQQMQSDLADTQRRLADTHVSGTSGGGLVKATVTGDRELVALTIDPSAVDPADTETLADLVVAAVRAANEHARTVGEQAMAERMPDLSGVDLGALGELGAIGGSGGAGVGADFGPSVPGGAATASIPPLVPDDPADAYSDLGTDAPGPRDSGPRDSGPRDSGPRDSGPRDSGPRDSGPRDSERRDSGPGNSGTDGRDQRGPHV